MYVQRVYVDRLFCNYGHLLIEPKLLILCDHPNFIICEV